MGDLTCDVLVAGGGLIGASAALAEMVAEKQKAFTDGAFAAGRAVIQGARPDVVAAAALRPSRRRVSANMRALRKS